MDGMGSSDTKKPTGKTTGTDPLRRGPPSGWVNLRENGRDMLVIDTEGLDFVEDSFPGISFGGGFWVFDHVLIWGWFFLLQLKFC